MHADGTLWRDPRCCKRVTQTDDNLVVAEVQDQSGAQLQEHTSHSKTMPLKGRTGLSSNARHCQWIQEKTTNQVARRTKLEVRHVWHQAKISRQCVAH